jgi:hypothetical protein
VLQAAHVCMHGSMSKLHLLGTRYSSVPNYK